MVYLKRGAIAQGLGERVRAELAEAGFLLESSAVDRAAGALREALADDLGRCVARQHDVLARDDVPTFIDLTLTFHRCFVEVSNSSVLLERYGHLSDRHRFTLFAAGDRLLSSSSEIISEHELLIHHLRGGDTVAFAKTLGQHIAENLPPQAATR